MSSSSAYNQDHLEVSYLKELSEQLGNKIHKIESTIVLMQSSGVAGEADLESVPSVNEFETRERVCETFIKDEMLRDISPMNQHFSPTERPINDIPDTLIN